MSKLLDVILVIACFVFAVILFCIHERASAGVMLAAGIFGYLSTGGTE
jgi:hypothetical protein